MKTFVMSVLTSLILMSIVFVVGPRNSILELETKVDNIDQRITQLEANNTQLTDSLNEALSEQMAYISLVQEKLKASIQAVEDNQSGALTSLSTDVASATALVQSETTQRAADITRLTSDIDKINDSLSSLSKDLGDLEEAVEDIEDEDEDLTAVITSTDDLEIDDGDDAFSGTMVVKVSNDTSDDVEDVKLLLSLEADEDIPDVDTATLEDDNDTWYFYYQDDNILYFRNYYGFDVDEDDYEKFTLNLEVYFESDVTEDTEFEASVEIIDYD